MDSPRPFCEIDAAAVKIQKAYKGYRTRRKLADSAIVVEELWWKSLDSAALKQSSVTFFNAEKHETASSQWKRGGNQAAKIGKGLLKNGKAQKLALQHWLEAIDPRHRYGHNLHFYYDLWYDCGSSQPFFYWLDVGDGKEVNHERCPRSKLQSQCIEYLGPKEREVYEVIVEDGKLVYKQGGKCVDTVEGSKWIFVLSTSGSLYVGKKKKGQFVQSSFLSGAATTAAGRLVAHNGVLKAIYPYSGYYLPTEENFKEFISFLEEHHVDLTNVKRWSADEDYPLLFNAQPHKFDLAQPLSCKWSTGTGPRIGCISDYATGLEFRALEHLKLSSRPIPSPRPSPKIRLSPRLAYMDMPSPKIRLSPKLDFLSSQRCANDEDWPSSFKVTDGEVDSEAEDTEGSSFKLTDVPPATDTSSAPKEETDGNAQPQKEREVYEVIVEDGKLVYKEGGECVDTVEGFQWIFVLSTSRSLYVGKKKKGQFQHSTFLSGGATTAAGRLVAHDGVLEAIWPYSGHYLPTEENFKEFISFLEEHHVDLTNVKVIRAPTVPPFPPNDSLKAGANDEDCPSSFKVTDSEVDSEAEDTEGSSFKLTDVHPVIETSTDPKKQIDGNPQSQKRLWSKWRTKAAHSIRYIRSYPIKLQVAALEYVNLSQRVGTGNIGHSGPIRSPRPSPEIQLSPIILAHTGLPSRRRANFLSPKDGTGNIGYTGPHPSPPPASRKIRRSPRLSNMGLPSPCSVISKENSSLCSVLTAQWRNFQVS